MPPRPRQTIVYRLIGCTTRGARQALSGVVDLKDDDAFALAKVDVDHAPRRAEPEGLGEQSFHRQSLPVPPRLGKNPRKINHTIRERADNGDPCEPVIVNAKILNDGAQIKLTSLTQQSEI